MNLKIPGANFLLIAFSNITNLKTSLFTHNNNNNNNNNKNNNFKRNKKHKNNTN